MKVQLPVSLEVMSVFSVLVMVQGSAIRPVTMVNKTMYSILKSINKAIISHRCKEGKIQHQTKSPLIGI